VYLAVDKDGKVYVGDTMNFRIQVFDDNASSHALRRARDAPGDFQRIKGSRSTPSATSTSRRRPLERADLQPRVSAADVFRRVLDKLEYFDIPSGIAISPKNRIYVCNEFFSRINVYDLINTKADDSVAPPSPSPSRELRETPAADAKKPDEPRRRRPPTRRSPTSREDAGRDAKKPDEPRRRQPDAKKPDEPAKTPAADAAAKPSPRPRHPRQSRSRQERSRQAGHERRKPARAPVAPAIDPRLSRRWARLARRAERRCSLHRWSDVQVLGWVCCRSLGDHTLRPTRGHLRPSGDEPNSHEYEALRHFTLACCAWH